MSKDFVRPPPLELSGTVPLEDRYEKMPVHEQWTCGHVATAMCAECYQELAHKANQLAAENERLRAGLELIAGSATDKLQALQAKSTLDNIGPQSSAASNATEQEEGA